MRAGEWANRCLHELSSWEKAAFVTLTYEHLPIGGSLYRDEAVRFLKRLRKELAPRRIRYYLCGEYGERNQRPHYHAVIFGVDREDTEVIREAWGLGFVYVGTVTFESIRYVTGYIQKALLGAPEKVYGDRLPPFALMSKGLGKCYCDQNAEQLRDSLGCTVGGVQYGLPRYYARRLGITYELPELREARLDRAAEVVQYHQGAKRTGEHWTESRLRSREQTRRNIEARSALKEREL